LAAKIARYLLEYERLLPVITVSYSLILGLESEQIMQGERELDHYALSRKHATT